MTFKKLRFHGNDIDVTSKRRSEDTSTKGLDWKLDEMVYLVLM